jgi:hypothetical protein
MTAGIARNRGDVRRILGEQSGGLVMAPMLERHAARLEQLAPGQTSRDAESLARALRGAQQLYGLAVLTVGDGGDSLVRAIRVVGSDPQAALAAPAFAVALDAMGRLRKVLADRAALVVTLPAAGRLVRECGLSRDGASAVLVEAIRACGDREPDAFILTGHDDEPDPVHDTLGSFYGAPVIRVGERPTGLVDVWPDFDPPADLLPEAFLVTTPTEITAGIDPSAIHSALAAGER